MPESPSHDQVQHGVPPELVDFVASRTGRPNEFSYCGWDHGEALVWECLLEGGRRTFLKQPSDKRKFVQERDAYESWAPQLAGLSPELLAADEALGAILLTAVPGVLAERLARDPTSEVDLYQQAGALLAALHTVPHVDDDIALDEALIARSESWARRSTDHVDRKALEWMKGRVREVAHLVADLGRVPCHRDFTPRNWVVDDDGVLRVIDFGHSRPDLWILDVEKVWSLHLAERGDRADAFWDGYGHSPTDEDRAVLEAAAALSAVSTITWSREHGDAAFEAMGRHLLDRVARSPGS